MARKQRLKKYPWQQRTAVVARLENVLRDHFPQALCRVFPAGDQRLRVLVIDDQFNGLEFMKKRKFVLNELNRARDNAELTPADMNEIGSIEVFSPLELV